MRSASTATRWSRGCSATGPDGHSLHFTAKGSSITLAGSRRGSLIVLEDVTAAERFWARMTVADKVTSLGILSAGMAHEINNPLGTILSHVNYLKAVEKESDKLDSLSWIESGDQPDRRHHPAHPRLLGARARGATRTPT